MRPYSPLELAGRDIYVREGCYVCHSQMIRPMRDEVERYGHYSLAAESMYDHPFQWGSKRTGPDLARVGGRYSDDWHVAHMHNPRDIVPESIMPAYPWLATTPIDAERIARDHAAHRAAGVPYTDEMIAAARADFRAQADPDTGDVDGARSRAIPRRRRATSTASRAISELDAVSPICRCSARWSTSRPSSPTRAGRRHGRPTPRSATSPTAGASSSWSLAFCAVLVWVFRPGARKAQDEAASQIFRNEDAPRTMQRRSAILASPPRRHLWVPPGPEAQRAATRSATRTRRSGADRPRDRRATQTETTGHEWDGIKELDTPMPRWWLWTLLRHHRLGGDLHRSSSRPGRWSPARPRGSSATRAAPNVAAEIAAARRRQRRARRAADRRRTSRRSRTTPSSCTSPPPAAPRSSATTARSATAPAPPASSGTTRTSSTTTGSGAAPSPTSSRPSPTASATTPTPTPASARCRPSARSSQPARDRRPRRSTCCRSPARPTTRRAAAGRRDSSSLDNCASCHGEDGTGGREFGAPNLTDGIWLYGGDAATRSAPDRQRPLRRHAGLRRPARPEDIAKVAVYVHSLGGGE